MVDIFLIVSQRMDDDRFAYKSEDYEAELAKSNISKEE